MTSLPVRKRVPPTLSPSGSSVIFVPVKKRGAANAEPLGQRRGARILHVEKAANAKRSDIRVTQGQVPADVVKPFRECRDVRVLQVQAATDAQPFGQRGDICAAQDEAGGDQDRQGSGARTNPR